MSQPPASAAPHRRTRADHATELAEDYVEAIAEVEDAAGQCRAVDLTRRFGVTAVTVNRTIARLVRDGLAETEPYGPVTLTPKGRQMAAESKRRHDIVFRFLRSLGVSEAVAAVDAEGIEHHVSPETLKRFEELARESGGGT